MGQHRARTSRSLRGRTVVAGIVGAGALLAAGPAAMAFADDQTTPGGATGGRPDFTNPAPGVRMVQSVGDSTFDNWAPLDNSPLGTAYHAAFGYSATGAEAYNVAHPGANVQASNGYVTGVLNSPIPGVVYASTVNIRECQIIRANANASQPGSPQGIRDAVSTQCGAASTGGTT